MTTAQIEQTPRYVRNEERHQRVLELIANNERDKLFEESHALMLWAASRFVRMRPNDRDDIIQLATIELWKGSQEYYPEMPFSFATFVKKRVEWAILQEWSKNKVLNRRADVEYFDPIDPVGTTVDRLVDAEDTEEQSQHVDRLRDVMTRLPIHHVNTLRDFARGLYVLNERPDGTFHRKSHGNCVMRSLQLLRERFLALPEAW
jgi:DNA-directed RNA polymerase specialized sigma24 family protein